MQHGWGAESRATASTEKGYTSDYYQLDEEDNKHAMETAEYEVCYFGGSGDGSMKTDAQSAKDNADGAYRFYFYTKDQNVDDYKSNSDDMLYKGAEFDITDKQNKYSVTKGLGKSSVIDIDLGNFVEGVN